MPRLFVNATTWIARQPLVTLLVILAISSFALLGYIDPGIIKRTWAAAKSPANSPLEDKEETGESENDSSGSQSFQRVPRMQMGGDAILIVESEQIFTPRGAEALREVVRHLRDLDHIGDIRWLESVPTMNLFGLAEPVLPRSDASQERFDRARQKALDHPLLRAQYLSGDAGTTLLFIDFDILMIRSDDDCISGLRIEAARAIEEFSDVEMKFSVTGRIPIMVSAIKSQDDSRLLYQTIAYSIILILSMILFRGLAAVIIVAGAAALGVFWTIGITSFYEIQFNPLVNVILPVLVALVGFTDGVHLMVAIRRIRASGKTSKEAAVEGIREVGMACFLTSVTTAIGLGSLMLAQHELVQEFGKCSVIGVVLTFLSVITWIPFACSTRLGKNLHVGLERSLIHRNLEKISALVDFVIRHKVACSLGGIGCLIVAGGISATLRPDQRQATQLPRSSEVAIAMARLDQALGGLETSQVNIQWTGNVPFNDPEIGEVIQAVDKILGDEELIGYPLSIMRISGAIEGERTIESQMSLIDLLPPSLKRTFYSPEERTATTIFRVQDLGIAKYGPIFERIQERLEELKSEHPEFLFRLTGSAVWRWENLYQIVVDLLASLGTAAIIIFVVLGFVYRSFRIGLISVFPNLFPLAIAGVYLVFIGQSLEIVTVCAFTVCLGIAVDDTIHFLTRFQEERRNADIEESIRRAFTSVGTALLITTVVLVAGFSSVFFSDSRDHVIFASMGSITIAAALLADLLVLPALLAWWLKR
ncbi:MAG: MMPL family transporter [Pirellulaceae bacterium]|nr:MMPL family transporter [Pirellulaceae bacterium]